MPDSRWGSIASRPVGTFCGTSHPPTEAGRPARRYELTSGALWVPAPVPSRTYLRWPARAPTPRAGVLRRQGPRATNTHHGGHRLLRRHGTTGGGIAVF